MATLLQIDFPFAGPFGEEMAQAFAELAATINDEPGFMWKIWTESQSAQQAGGIYLFDTEENARAYLKKHTARLNGFGISGIEAKVFDVNESLSAITRGPIK
ncbi:monooxygenase [Marinobacterium lutimaris]|uniref:Putative mono-oxygenase ydhR n=1 Tax=Marinobacterium lutimaris TaxID=568106 RepID=A0A1H6DMF6_9GAMM|nr:monooxygenase [Marinobacterium lutimaris]SEG86399.1 Putative mono-oxygenase ydhR [Marinobacterium lutimaris]